jgi:serine phosphatase RsbU (regulator of sigma subunit)
MCYYPRENYVTPLDSYEKERQEYMRRQRAKEQAYRIEVQRQDEELLRRQCRHEEEDAHRRQLLDMQERHRLKQAGYSLYRDRALYSGPAS